MANTDQTQQLTKVLEQLATYKTVNLITRPEWGIFTFDNIRFDLETVLSFVDNYQSLPTQYLPDQTIRQITNSFKNILPCYQRLNKFSIAEGGNPTQQKTQIEQEFHARADEVYVNTAVWIPYLSYQKGDVTENINRMAEAIVRVEKLYNESTEKLGEKKNQIENILVKAKEAAASVGAAVFTEDFSKEAERNNENAQLWLCATIAFASAAIILSIWAYNADYSHYTTALSLWPKLASKMILLSLCVTASTWCGRIYKSARHLSILNQHRALGLKTFQAFSSAASDSHTKDMVLMETTRSIFSNSSTGLIAENGTGESDSNIIQIAGKALEQTHVK